MSDSYRALVSGTKLVKDAAPAAKDTASLQDDPAFPATYQAIRRVRSWPFSDAGFRTHNGAVQAFPWFRLNTRLHDGTGAKLTLVWPEMAITLTGRNLHLIEDDIQRRIVAEFRQIAPDQTEVEDGTPVIERIEFEAVG